MNPFIKLAIGCCLIGAGVVVNLGAQKQLVERFAKPCEDCDDEVAPLDEDIPSFVDVHNTEDDSDNG